MGAHPYLSNRATLYGNSRGNRAQQDFNNSGCDQQRNALFYVFLINSLLPSKTNIRPDQNRDGVFYVLFFVQIKAIVPLKYFNTHRAQLE